VLPLGSSLVPLVTGVQAYYWSEIASTNPLERAEKEIRCRSNIIGIFPGDHSVIRCVGAVLAEACDWWKTAQKLCLSEGSMYKIGEPPTEIIAPYASELPAAPHGRRPVRSTISITPLGGTLTLLHRSSLPSDRTSGLRVVHRSCCYASHQTPTHPLSRPGRVLDQCPSIK